MTDKKRDPVKDAEKPNTTEGKGVQPNPGVGQKLPYDKGQKNTQGNPAGQGNEDDEEVMQAGRETPG